EVLTLQSLIENIHVVHFVHGRIPSRLGRAQRAQRGENNEIQANPNTHSHPMAHPPSAREWRARTTASRGPPPSSDAREWRRAAWDTAGLLASRSAPRP